MENKSKIFGVNIRDFAYGLVVAFLGAIATALHQLLSSNQSFSFDWITFKPIVYTGITAGFAYLIKNFFSNSKGDFGKLEMSGPGGGSNPPEGTAGLPPKK